MIMIQYAHLVKAQGYAAVAMVVVICQEQIRINLAFYVKVQENVCIARETVATLVIVVMTMTTMMIKNSVLHVTVPAFAHGAVVQAFP